MRTALSMTAFAALASLALPSTAEAAVINGGFEDGLTGWQAIGDNRVETSDFGIGPVEGNSQAFLSTAFNEVVGLDENYNEIVGGNAVPVTYISNTTEGSNLEEFLDSSTFLGEPFLDSLATAVPTEGSAIKQTFTASAGETLSFSWNFLTNESTGLAAVDDSTFPDFNDFAFAVIQSDLGRQWFSLADTVTEFGDTSISTFGSETGFRTFSYEIPTTGDYTIGIGVVDVGDSVRTSALLVDKFEAVPEPDSVLGTLGLLFLGVGWRLFGRERRQKIN